MIRARGMRQGCAVLATSLLLFGVPASAASPDLTIQARLGLGGWVVPGAVTPLRVEITAARPLEGMLLVEVPAAVRTDRVLRYTVPLRAPAGATQQVGIDLIIRDPRRPLLARVLAGGTERARLVIPVGAARTVEGIVLALSREQAGLEFLAAGSRRLRPVYVRESDLPPRWQSYAAVTALIIRDLDGRSLTVDQQRALTEWLGQGGRLLVVSHEGLDLRGAPWLADLLPVEVPPFFAGAIRSGSVPVPVVPLRARPNATVETTGGVLLGASRAYGRGTVDVWAFDPFAPDARGWPGRLRYWQALLSRPSASPIATGDLAGQLPQTRALPGGPQVLLAVLSVVYIIGVRLVLRRFARIRGGWAAIAAGIAVFGAGLYALSSGARQGATTVVQVTVLEMLPGIPSARATTYASVLAPYGGQFALRAPSGSAIQPLDAADLSIDAARNEITGRVPAGRLLFEATDVAPIDVRAAVQSSGGPLEVTVFWQNAPPAQASFLYRGGQIYSLPRELAGAVRIDPDRWERLEHNRALATPEEGLVLEWIARRLDHRDGADLWLLARVDEERYTLRLARGRVQSIQLLVVPVQVR